MDIMKFDIVKWVRFVAEHNEKVIGALVVAFLVTSILLLIRSLNEGKDSGSVSNVQINLDEIEALMKRLLGSGVAVSTGPGVGIAGAAMSEDAQSAITERETRIRDLASQLEQMKSELDKKGSGGSAVDESAMIENQKRIEELQARLAEYEIIEDDIADLSRFKLENAELKAKIERLKMRGAGAAPAPVAASAVELKDSSAQDSSAAAETSSGFEIDPTDQVMREFASAVQGASAPALEVATVVAGRASGPSSMSDVDAAQASIEAELEQALARQSEPEPSLTQTEPSILKQSSVDDLLNSVQLEEAVSKPLPAPRSQADVDDLFSSLQAQFGESAPSAQSDPKPSSTTEQSSAANSSVTSILDASVDTDKMLNEAEMLAASDDLSLIESSATAEETLDTDKLLQEISGMDDQLHSGGSHEDIFGKQKPEDDLLAEFRDDKKSSGV